MRQAAAPAHRPEIIPLLQGATLMSGVTRLQHRQIMYSMVGLVRITVRLFWKIKALVQRRT
jgi:hypothetical protein